VEGVMRVKIRVRVYDRDDKLLEQTYVIEPCPGKFELPVEEMKRNFPNLSSVYVTIEFVE
jgi:hypothetical protein